MVLQSLLTNKFNKPRGSICSGREKIGTNSHIESEEVKIGSIYLGPLGYKL